MLKPHFVFRFQNDDTLIVRHAHEENIDKLFAAFVSFTQTVGYHQDSWRRLLLEVVDDVDDNYSIYDWALDTSMNS